MKSISSALLFSATLTSLDAQGLGGQALSGVEQRISSEVDARAEEAIDLLERAVNIHSGSMNFAGRAPTLVWRRHISLASIHAIACK
jgi:hypothetical protein